jgi:hypothetical protein
MGRENLLCFYVTVNYAKAIFMLIFVLSILLFSVRGKKHNKKVSNLILHKFANRQFLSVHTTMRSTGKRDGNPKSFSYSNVRRHRQKKRRIFEHFQL